MFTDALSDNIYIYIYIYIYKIRLLSWCNTEYYYRITTRLYFIGLNGFKKLSFLCINFEG